jgi:hypothetical protein
MLVFYQTHFMRSLCTLRLITKVSSLLEVIKSVQCARPLLTDFQSPGHLHCVKRQAQFFTVQYIMCIIMCIAQGQCATAVR